MNGLYFLLICLFLKKVLEEICPKFGFHRGPGGTVGYAWMLDSPLNKKVGMLDNWDVMINDNVYYTSN